MKHISTTALAKKIGISANEMFMLLSEAGLIRQESESWTLTDAGLNAGGEYKESARYGQYIVWSEKLDINGESIPILSPNSSKLLTSTAIGKHFGLSPNKINFVLSELGWLKKGLKGWLVTEQGKKQQHGVQAEVIKSGVPYARWPETILKSKALIDTVNALIGTETHGKQQNILASESPSNFREKFEAQLRTTDGHFVRSKAEMLIDNWLYMAEIIHAYERKLPIEEDVYCDFYIPTGKVYIEYWGYENDAKYLHRKKEKEAIYQKYGFNLIELEDKDVKNLDDILPKHLLKYGVQAY